MKLVDEFFTHFYEMAREGGFSTYSVHVYTNEKMIPHFHFKNNDREGCICLEKAMYFIHANKTATLNRGECEELVKFLASEKPTTGKTYYKVLCELWNLCNPNRTQIKKGHIMPNYMKIKRNK